MEPIARRRSGCVVRNRYRHEPALLVERNDECIVATRRAPDNAAFSGAAFGESEG
ncbi:hypothetical protein BURPS1710A_A1488 [Burkholderia pseudomallei 1710a]|uniref:Uncharacterized protein n=1 Tax=Burkholderia pseudomallei 1710a TaxID=320371 RepID=A0A0E1W8T6_BURPE|nr:hypothetical protein BURPS1710A_A1488 [Burkholderia pseudomallei 1710a]